MTFKNFCEINNIELETQVEACESETKVYKDFETQESTDEHVIYFLLPKKVRNQDYIVLSRRAAQAVLTKDKLPSELEVAEYEESYFLQLPARHKRLKLKMK
jgi:hypothetical protein